MSDLKRLAKLRQTRKGTDLDKYSYEELRQNWMAIEDAFRRSGKKIDQLTQSNQQLNLVGEMKMWPGPVIPAGYLKCDGSLYEISEYPALAAALFDASTGKYAWGSSGTKFNVPYFRGIFPRGVDEGDGNDPDAASRTAISAGGNTGNRVGSFQDDEYQSHNHTITVYNTGGGAVVSQGAGSPVASTQLSGNSGGNETRPKNAYVYFIIKY